MNKYVHGYDQQENIRLQDQASTLVDLLHSDTMFPAGSRVLEAGCGVGAQTITLAKNSPKAHITSIDISETSVAKAKKRVESEGFTKKTFTAMIEGIREAAINTKMIDPEEIDEGIRDLYRTTEPDGVFCYTFFKAVAKEMIASMNRGIYGL